MKQKIIKDYSGYKPSLLRRILYPVVSTFFHIFIYIYGSKPKYDKRYKLTLCTIFKNEAKFLKEWIEFHLLVGVEHFYLYNNNSEDNFAEVLTPYIEEGIVTLTDWPMQKGQIPAYKHWYDNYRSETQWVSFLDADEFICPRYNNTIVEWLDKYSKYPVISIYWRFFGTSGNETHDDDKLIIEQYHICYDGLVEPGKLLYNTDYDIAKFYDGMMHLFSAKIKGISIPPINEYRSFLFWAISRVKRDSTIQVNHYWSKAFDVYQNKITRGNAVLDVHWVNLDALFRNESHNVTADYLIYRYLMRLKYKLYLENHNNPNSEIS